MSRIDDQSTLIRVIIISILLLIIVIGSFEKKNFKIDKFFILLILIIILPGLTLSFYKAITFLFKNFVVYKYLFIGIGIGIPFVYLLKRFLGFSTFEHEATHAFVSLLFLRRVTAFVVTKHDGGYIKHTSGFGGRFGDHMIYLAPYFFPLVIFILVVIRPLLNFNFFPWWDILIGMWFTFYLFTYFSEIRGQWHRSRFNYADSDEVGETDIAHEGFIFSFFFILSMTMFFYGFLLHVIYKEYPGIWEFFREIYNQNLLFYNYI